jgi:hypothetical protein
VLFGYARGTPTGRVKLYLQFKDGAGSAPLALARAVTGVRRPLASESLPLHLLGLDVGDEGLAGAKFYFLARALAPGETSTWAPRWHRPLANALLIHRAQGPDDPGAARPSDLDFAPDESGFGWSELAASTALAPYGALLSSLADLSREFRLRVRRVSLARPPAHRLNVYYALDETSPLASSAGAASTSKPPGGG